MLTMPSSAVPRPGQPPGEMDLVTSECRDVSAVNVPQRRTAAEEHLAAVAGVPSHEGPGDKQGTTQERSERTRRKLVLAAAELFGGSGYAHASLARIAASAGVTTGALHFHFATKAALAEAVQHKGCATLDELVKNARRSQGSALQVLIDTTHAVARSLYDNPYILASFRITRERAGKDPSVINFYQMWISRVWALLQTARDTGEVSRHTAEGGLEMLVAAAASGIEVLPGTGMPYTELAGRVSALWEMALPLLLPPGTAPSVRTGPPQQGMAMAQAWPGWTERLPLSLVESGR